MAQVDTVDSPMTTADGMPLKASLRRAERRNQIKAVTLVLPLFVFLVVSFLLPIGDMLFRSVENSEVVEYLPNTIEAIQEWDGEGVPSEPVYAAMFEDLKAGREAHTIGRVGSRLNYEMGGARSLITRSARKVKRLEGPPYKDGLIGLDKRWGDQEIWRVIKRESGAYTLSYFLSALDMTYNDAGDIISKPDEQSIYVDLFYRTFWMSGAITLLCLLFGYPVSFLLATLPLRHSNLLMILVLLPFWTSLLVRTTTWIAILQSQGVLNDIFVAIGLIDDDNRLQMIHNQTGTLIAMTHILLPFMILPLYSVMKTIPPSYMRAARSLGATPWTAFWKVYVPQTLSGIGAGGILVFILSIGYYITPALVGGQTGRFITNFIAYHMNVSLNWGLAAAIGSILLGIVLVFYLLYNRVVGIDNMKLG
ncbi:ABC transporter permease [Aestuariispira ectoiniformans]|uniref:ABC transporter permease n=1 Tax=Aestuariispira ectoiniformans TaxID=2775080 RepID=UPI00223C52D2|nr:ABC transporter permease [Aestuariispira ectoiniformans]